MQLVFIQCEILRLGNSFEIIEESNILLSPLELHLRHLLLQKILAFKGDRAFRDVIARAACEDVAKGALARSVGTHDGVHLARLNGEAQSAKDVLAINAGVQVFNLKHVLYLRN